MLSFEGISKTKERHKMTKEHIKEKYLVPIAAKIKDQWYGQATHKMAVCVAVLDLAEIKDQAKRDKVMKEWLETPSSFGANCSALGQALGRESTKAKIEKTFAGF